MSYPRGEFLSDLMERGDSEDAGQSFWLEPQVPIAGFLKRAVRSYASDDEQAANELKDIPDGDIIAPEVAKALPLCESPIERILLPWLLAQEYTPFGRPTVMLPGEGGRLEYAKLALVPQLPIGRFRADFALVGKGREFIRFFIIECDGADYHDQDKDAARDAQIRSLNKNVRSITRLTGGLIMNDPRGAAEQVRLAVSREYGYWGQ